MLTNLYVRDLAIVEQAELSLTDGMSVLTGETGAGKSILIDALALLLGQRADTGLIRHGRDTAEVLASFDVDESSDAANWLNENELFVDGECVLRRLIHRDKPSRAFINGRPSPVQWLRELGQRLVDIHGQNEHQSLTRRDTQRQILDDFAGHGGKVAELSTRYREIQDLTQRLDALTSDDGSKKSRLELLSYQAEELNAFAIEPGDYEDLVDQQKRLSSAAEIIQTINHGISQLADPDADAIGDRLSSLIENFTRLAQAEPEFSSIAELLEEASIRVDEAAKSLRQMTDRVVDDPAALDEVDRRLAGAHDLARKHDVRPDSLPELLQRITTELEGLSASDETVQALQERIEDLSSRYNEIATTVRRGRKKAARLLANAVTDSMQKLGMAGGEFSVDVAPLEDSEITRYGRDRVEFLVSANAGQPQKALARVASGGELSRISLAIQVIVSSIGRVPTLVFDEVDVGIGGGVAEIVGRQLRALGDAQQVICVTHLAQVAASATQQFHVLKSGADDTMIEVTQLDESTRVTEIARMLGGLDLTKQSLAHAEEMLLKAAS